MRNFIACQEGGFPNFLKLFKSVGLPLRKNVLTPLAISVLVKLGLTASASVTDAAIQKKIYGSETTTLVFSDKGMISRYIISWYHENS